MTQKEAISIKLFSAVKTATQLAGDRELLTEASVRNQDVYVTTCSLQGHWWIQNKQFPFVALFHGAMEEQLHKKQFGQIAAYTESGHTSHVRKTVINLFAESTVWPACLQSVNLFWSIMEKKIILLHSPL
ncbi:hypothetical protein OS493_006562 [Desmophyllum pertusum]|uniref:Uncharacterized protein n=1 Tax=Desmophyllum pertusum TaxID=174260 RepID=A0A9X0A547_9CNID|nr:hypothetical protein OS493_006562 [Desmophyllum pertusum]